MAIPAVERSVLLVLQNLDFMEGGGSAWEQGKPWVRSPGIDLVC